MGTGSRRRGRRIVPRGRRGHAREVNGWWQLGFAARPRPRDVDSAWRRRRGRDADSPAGTRACSRGQRMMPARGDSAAAAMQTWRRRCGRVVDSPSGRGSDGTASGRGHAREVNGWCQLGGQRMVPTRIDSATAATWIVRGDAVRSRLRRGYSAETRRGRDADVRKRPPAAATQTYERDRPRPRRGRGRDADTAATRTHERNRPRPRRGRTKETARGRDADVRKRRPAATGTRTCRTGTAT